MFWFETYSVRTQPTSKCQSRLQIRMPPNSHVTQMRAVRPNKSALNRAKICVELFKAWAHIFPCQVQRCVNCTLAYNIMGLKIFNPWKYQTCGQLTDIHLWTCSGPGCWKFNWVATWSPAREGRGQLFWPTKPHRGKNPLKLTLAAPPGSVHISRNIVEVKDIALLLSLAPGKNKNRWTYVVNISQEIEMALVLNQDSGLLVVRSPVCYLPEVCTLSVCW